MKTNQSLNPNYIFDTFIDGPSNREALTLSRVVAKLPGKVYNPLFIFGDVGLGKTHLLQAIGHYVRGHSKAHVNYISCEALMNEYIDSLQNRRVKHFRDKYRNTDLLLIDDIHFLTKTATLQEEIFHIFNVLHDAHKQVVMASGQPANEISRLERRLVSRFEWGLVAEILPPDVETRMAILRSKQKMMNLSIDKTVLIFIANHIKDDIRPLEGALLRLAHYTSIYRKPVTMNMAKSLLKSFLEEKKEGKD